MAKATSTEIGELRRAEAQVETGSRELDRLALALLDWPRHIVVMALLPPGSWAELPEGWQSAAALRLTPQRGLPTWRGPPVAVSLQTAEDMVNHLKRQRR